ncbi:nuclear transport factor 2 family protein [Dactylosporangium sp. CA-233914]|uniref:nuclear transport factor 2 family protein n=1 Tax=Dactylosporangium sp. CA-233914 TaxID=3239934 RepID=UPI003D931271
MIGSKRVRDELAVRQLYARQAQAIDGGQAEAWARTFTVDGEFRSETYPAPVIGWHDLAEFARDFTRAAALQGEVHRHWMNALAFEHIDRKTARAKFYLAVLAADSSSSRILRHVLVDDELARDRRGWLVRIRIVRADRPVVVGGGPR